MHGVVSPGAQVTWNEATTVAMPVPAALNTAVAVLPEGRHEIPCKTELSEIVGGQLPH
ncbi:MAG: hypothetical protein ACLP5O_15275 [Acidimicrobiales bacterium]